jgi:hypothetical protein
MCGIATVQVTTKNQDKETPLDIAPPRLAERLVGRSA